MIKYEVKDVVCDYGVFENGELKLICNSHANALKIKEILETDSDMSKPYIWKDKKVEELENKLKNAIVPKFNIGQKVYMIPNEFNGLKNLTEYKVLDYNLSSLGVRFNLTIINKQKGIEPFYCASEDMINISIFADRESALKVMEDINNAG